jgi:hypothetical protein
MGEHNNGGPAFPTFDVVAGDRDGHGDVIDAYTVASGGMSMRDYFAGMALPAIITATSAGQHMPTMREGEPHIRFAIARDAYDMADAMLAAKAEGRTNG